MDLRFSSYSMLYLTRLGAPYAQKITRSPICPVLVDATPWILPKLGAVTFRTGLLYCRQLNALNASARSCSRIPRERLNDFAIARSTRRRPGPWTCEGFCVPGRSVARVIGEVGTSV